MESLGAQIRRQRRRLGLTLDDLAGRTSISKPYLSLIETGRVPNPPSDDKLSRIEQTLGFRTGELLAQAHLQRTPRDVRAMLGKLLGGNVAVDRTVGVGEPALAAAAQPFRSIDDAYLSGLLREMVDRHAGNVETIPVNAVPIINKVTAGYPRDFTDLSYPRGIADAYVSCPDVSDPDAFAARISGDSMTPRYREGDIVIFSPKLAVKSGHDAFIRFDDGQTTFKRVFYETDDAGQAVIRLQPRNEKYRPQIIPAEKITGIWRAVYRYEAVGEG
jgi:repressor LexA